MKGNGNARRQILSAAACAAAAAALLSTSPAHAITRHGTNPSGGVYSDPANWFFAGGPPQSGDDAVFDLNNTYPVTFSGQPSQPSQNVSYQQTRGNITFTGSSQ